MVSTLYPELQTALNTLITSIEGERRPQYGQPQDAAFLPALSDGQLRPRLQAVWAGVNPENTTGEGSDGARTIEFVRSVLELAGKDAVVAPLASPEVSEAADEEGRIRMLTALQDRLDVVLTLYEVVYESHAQSPQLEPGALFIPLLEELVELLSIEVWRDVWTYVETRSKRFTKDMPASRGKALPLLRIINAFLRFLPRTPADLVFRGRVHQFASSVIGVADQSATNMRGQYNDLKTTWEVDEVKDEGGAVVKENGNGDVSMEDSTEGVEKATETSAEPDFYSTLWSLQQYFANPPSLDGPHSKEPGEETPRTPFERFKSKTDFVLPKLFEQTQKEKALKVDDMTDGRKRKRSGSDDGGFFHPKYLTGKRLLEHELADVSFRRQILVQYFILFQFLLNLTPASAAKQAFTGGMPRTFIIDGEGEGWIKSTVQSIREELKRMGSDGSRFQDTVLSIIERERHYAQWKNEGCPPGIFEIAPADPAIAKKAADRWRRRSAPPRAYQYKVGSRTLSALWRDGFESIDQLKVRTPPLTPQALDEEILTMEAEEEDDKAMGKEVNGDFKERKTNLTWRALRTAAKTDLRLFGDLAQKRDLHVLVKKVKEAQEVDMGKTAGIDSAPNEEDAAEKDNGDAASEVVENEATSALSIAIQTGADTGKIAE